MLDSTCPRYAASSVSSQASGGGGNWKLKSCCSRAIESWIDQRLVVDQMQFEWLTQRRPHQLDRHQDQRGPHRLRIVLIAPLENAKGDMEDVQTTFAKFRAGAAMEIRQNSEKVPSSQVAADNFTGFGVDVLHVHSDRL